MCHKANMYLHQMNHGILEEDHVHAGSSDRLVVLAQEKVKPIVQTLKWLDRLVDFGHIKVSVVRLVPCDRIRAVRLNKLKTIKMGLPVEGGQYLRSRAYPVENPQSNCQRHSPPWACAPHQASHRPAWPKCCQTTPPPPARWICQRSLVCTRASTTPAEPGKWASSNFFMSCPGTGKNPTTLKHTQMHMRIQRDRPTWFSYIHISILISI